MRTPWGTADSVKVVAEGITAVSTPGHGGYKLSAKRNKMVPEALREKGGWYEEDCKYAVVLVTFPEHYEPKEVESARATLKDWYPGKYEKAYGVKVEPSESHILRERAEYEEVKNELLSYSAFGDWHKEVPEGMVGLLARVGGREGPKENPERWFLVPGEEYGNGKRFFVIDPARHKEITPLTSGGYR